jgi:hypothetical protein
VGHVHKPKEQFVCYNTLQWLHEVTKPLKIKWFYFQTYRKQKIYVNNCKRKNFKLKIIIKQIENEI